MAKKEKKILPEIVVSVTGKSYPLDIVKDSYLKSEQGLRGFCKRYGLKESIVEQYIRAGNWDELRDKYWERMFEKLGKDMIEIMEWKQSLIHRLESVTLMEIESTVHDIENHIMKYGDTFARDSEGEILRDGLGNPMSRGVHNTVYKTLESLHNLRNDNATSMVEFLNETPSLVPGSKEKSVSDDTLDVYKDFLEPSEE